MSPTAPGRKPYPSDVSDAEWEFVAPYLTLLPPAALQRTHDLCEVFNAVRWLTCAEACCIEALAHDLRTLLHAAQGRFPQLGGTTARSSIRRTQLGRAQPR